VFPSFSPLFTLSIPSQFLSNLAPISLFLPPALFPAPPSAGLPNASRASRFLQSVHFCA
jgi:hypothetical protein